ncbi:MAG TPA: hypothetical protein VKA95_15495 [Nitrososphaeraceae archaeon]|nr:hypothetical protein [Nitrososphaeraceae archaeon]
MSNRVYGNDIMQFYLPSLFFAARQAATNAAGINPSKDSPR